MKKLLLAYFLFLALVSNAQLFQPGDKLVSAFYIPFPPQSSVTSNSYDGDVMIDSILCQKVGINYFYSDSTSIYYYNQQYQVFNKIFDYSLPIGDSIFIYSHPTCPDTGYYTRIIDKGIDTINEIAYRWIEYLPSGESWQYTFRGKYYERLGFLDGYITPQEFCGVDAPFITCLGLLINTLTNDTLFDNRNNCPLILDVKEKPANLFYLYPNPITNGTLTIQSAATIKRIELIDMLGQNVLSTTPAGNTVNIGNLALGLYIAKVVFADGKTGYKRVVVE